jgi:hypothetical protein
MSGYNLTNAQVNRLVEMRKKGYPIHSLQFRSLEGHLTVGVRVKSYGKDATRYFFIKQNGGLK